MKNRVSLALVGAGYWGRKLLPKFLARTDGAVKAVCDIQRENLDDIHKSFPELGTTDSFAEVINNPYIEAVVIVTPLATHFSLAKKAIESGKHVWIEKPLALHLAEGRELVGLAKTRKVVLFVDHTFLYDPGIRRVRELVRRGELGDIYHVFLQRLNLGRIKRDSNVWWNSAPHDLSIVLYLLPQRLNAITVHGYRYLQLGLEDLNMAVLEMSSGTSAFIYHNWLYPENTAKLTVVGSKKLLVCEGRFEKRAVTLYEYTVGQLFRDEMPEQGIPTTIPSKMISEHRLEGLDAEEPLTLAINDFLESIRNGHAALSDGDFSLSVLEVLEAGEQSLRSGGKKVLFNWGLESFPLVS